MCPCEECQPADPALLQFSTDEWEIMELVARSQGWPQVLANAELILEQARVIGDL
jgi:hypothetical protein